MTDTDIDRVLDALDMVTERTNTRGEEEPDAGSSGMPTVIAAPPPLDERLGDAAHTLRMIARRIEAHRRAAAC
jgi:hypothetical protein